MQNGFVPFCVEIFERRNFKGQIQETLGNGPIFHTLFWSNGTKEDVQAQKVTWCHHDDVTRSGGTMGDHGCVTFCPG